MRDIDFTYRKRHFVHTSIALIVVLALGIAMVKLWPVFDEGTPNLSMQARGQETIQIDDIVQTQQVKKRPPPPPPPVPIVVPDDEIIDDYDLDNNTDFLALDDPGDDEAPVVSEGSPTGGGSREAHPVRIIQPSYTSTAKKKNVRALITIRVRVDEHGEVTDAQIVDRFLLDKDDNETPVELVGYGLEESALEAARQTLFRPARKDGQRVAGYYPRPLRFKFGT